MKKWKWRDEWEKEKKKDKRIWKRRREDGKMKWIIRSRRWNKKEDEEKKMPLKKVDPNPIFRSKRVQVHLTSPQFIESDFELFSSSSNKGTLIGN